MDDIIRPRRTSPASVTPLSSPTPAPTSAPISTPNPVAEPASDVFSVPVTRTAAPAASAMHAPDATPAMPSSLPTSAGEPLSLDSVDFDQPSTVPTPIAEPEPVAPAPAPDSPEAILAGANEPAPAGPQTPLTEDLLQDDTKPAASPSPSLLAEIEAQEAREREAAVSEAPVKSAGRKGHWFAIFVGLVIALALVAGAGYAYWQNKKDTAKPATNATQKTEVTKNPATAEDIDKASSDIDAAIKKIDETKEFQASDLSDSTLSL